jgi:hypothetical protein
MKIGDYLRAKKSFTRTIYTSTKNKINGDIIDSYENGQITVFKNNKYKITNIYNYFEIEVVEILIDDKKVSFSLNNNSKDFEYIFKLFTENIATIRLEKIKHLNQIITDIEEFICE